MLFSLEADLARMRRKAKAEKRGLETQKDCDDRLAVSHEGAVHDCVGVVFKCADSKENGIGFRSHEKLNERVISDG